MGSLTPHRLFPDSLAFTKPIKKVVILALLSFIFSGCQLTYILKSAHNQFSMMTTRQPVKALLQDPNLDPKLRHKLELSEKARRFAFEVLELKKTENYATYIDLKRPYVTWVVSASPKWEIKNHEWKYPLVGAMPYKGFFTEAEANLEVESLKAKNLDAIQRGVSAYSTLGWFTDSLLSSMLRYSDHDLVDTILHELVHTTIYVKNNAEFNERLAVFIGGKGTDLFYRKFEGENSKTIELIQLEEQDRLLFSNWLSHEIKELKIWYQNQSETTKTEDSRQNRLREIQTRFVQNLKPQLKTNLYQRFQDLELNNARLGLYATYESNMQDFQKAFEICDSELVEFIKAIKTLESEKKPEEKMKNWTSCPETGRKS